MLCFRTPLSVRKELLCVQCPGFPPGTLAFRLLESNTSASPGSGGQRGFCWWAAREETVNGQQPQGTARDKRPRSPVYERGLVAHPRSGSLRGRLPIDASQGCPPSSPGTSGGALFSPPLPHSRAPGSPGGELLHASDVPVFGAGHSGMPLGHLALLARGAPGSHGTSMISSSLAGYRPQDVSQKADRNAPPPDDKELYVLELQLSPAGWASSSARAQGLPRVLREPGRCTPSLRAWSPRLTAACRCLPRRCLYIVWSPGLCSCHPEDT